MRLFTRTKLLLVLGMGLLGLSALTKAFEAADSLPFSLQQPEESAVYSQQELLAVDQALKALAMTRTDLGFEKKAAESAYILPIVGYLMDNPLACPVFTHSFHERVVNAADPAETVKLAFAALGMASEPIPGQPSYDVPTTEEEWTALLAPVGGSLPSGFTNLIALWPRNVVTALALFLREYDAVRLCHEQALVKLSPAERRRLGALALALLVEEELACKQLQSLFAELEAKPPQDPAAELISLLHQVSLPDLTRAAIQSARLFTLMKVILGEQPTAQSITGTEVIPTIEIPTAKGTIMLGGNGVDVHVGDYLLVIELGGDDVYQGARLAVADGLSGSPLSFHFDLDGHDAYLCAAEDFMLAAAFCGSAFFLDARGNDVYRAAWFGQGAAVLGAAWFEDGGGSDLYTGKGFCQAAAGIGFGCLFEDQPMDQRDEGSGNDTYRAGLLAQGVSRTLGVGLLLDNFGNDVYSAGGMLMHRPLYSDRYQSLSQGFSIGVRPSIAGGLAFLFDRDGNDRYEGEVYGQAAGYWYSAGFLMDEAGNDGYTLTIYGQGSGIHLACGTLIDQAGNDSYLMTDGLGQGGAHDLAVGVLMDNAGNDRYVAGNASNQGVGLTNSVGLFIDRAGDDLYAAHSGLSNGAGRPERGYGSIGIFVDLVGADRYGLNGANHALWSGTSYGAGIDQEVEPPKIPAPQTGQSETAKSESDPQPAKRQRPTQQEFDQQWSVAASWGVGDNAQKTPAACATIASWGRAGLPFLEAKLATDDGLELRALTAITKLLIDQDRRSIVKLVGKALKSPEPAKLRNALNLVNELQLPELERLIVDLIEDKRLGLSAIGVAGRSGFTSALPKIQQRLHSEDEDVVAAAASALCRLNDLASTPDLLNLLEHQSVVIRMLLLERLPELGEPLADSLVAIATNPAASEMVRANTLTVLGKMESAVVQPRLAGLRPLQHDPSWVIRGRFVELLTHYGAETENTSVIEAMTATETHPYVLRLLLQP